jgi:hypothetical protein
LKLLDISWTLSTSLYNKASAIITNSVSRTSIRRRYCNAEALVGSFISFYVGNFCVTNNFKCFNTWKAKNAFVVVTRKSINLVAWLENGSSLSCV